MKWKTNVKINDCQSPKNNQSKKLANDILFPFKISRWTSGLSLIIWYDKSWSQQAINTGVTIIEDKITEVDFVNRPFILSSEKGNSYTAQSIIIATGSSAKWLELESEKKYIGFGVSACATCDAFFYKNKTVAVVGGGNSAAEEALYLTNFASKVILIHRRDTLRADNIMQKRLQENHKINILWNSVIKEIKGDENPKSVNMITVKNVKTD